MTVEDLVPVETLQWAPSGNGLEGKPGEVMYFLASEDGTTRGYGYGPRWSIVFYSEQGEIKLEAGQWLIRLSSGLVVVEDERPADVALFDVDRRREEIRALRGGTLP